MKRYCFTFILTALNIIAFPSSIALRSNAKYGKSRKRSKAGKATKSKYKFHKSYSTSSRNSKLSKQSLVPSRIPSIEPSIQSSTGTSLSNIPSIQNISTQIPSTDSNNEVLSTRPSIVTDYPTPLPAPSRSSEPSIQSSTRTSLSKMPSIQNISTQQPSTDSSNEGLSTHPSIERATAYPTSLPAPSRSSIISTAPSKIDRISSSMPISGSSYRPSHQQMSLSEMPSSYSSNERLTTYPSHIVDTTNPSLSIAPSLVRKVNSSMPSITDQINSSLPIESISSNKPSTPNSSNSSTPSMSPIPNELNLIPSSGPTNKVRQDHPSTAPSLPQKSSEDGHFDYPNPTSVPSNKIDIPPSFNPTKRDEMHSSFPTISGLDSPLPSNKPTFKTPTIDSDVVNNNDQQNVAASRQDNSEVRTYRQVFSKIDKHSFQGYLFFRIQITLKRLLS